MSNHYDYMPKPEGWVPPERPTYSNPMDTPNTEPMQSKAPEETETKQKTPVSLGDVTEFEDTTPLEKNITLASNILSWVFVPLLMPVYGILLIFRLSILSLTSFQTKLFFTLVVFGANFVFPMLAVLLLKKLGMIDDIGLNGRKERLIPYIITVCCLAATGCFLHIKGAPLWVVMFYAGGSLAALINMAVNFRWKISAHAAGIAGIAAMLIQITKEGFPAPGMTLWIVGTIILSGILCSARVWLGRHTLLQVLAGSAVGFLCVWGLSMI